MFADKTIHKRVMTVVKTRIEKAQKDYEAGCEAHDQRCETLKTQAEAERESAKAALADTLVSDIVGKFI